MSSTLQNQKKTSGMTLSLTCGMSGSLTSGSGDMCTLVLALTTWRQATVPQDVAIDLPKFSVNSSTTAQIPTYWRQWRMHHLSLPYMTLPLPLLETSAWKITKSPQVKVRQSELRHATFLYHVCRDAQNERNGHSNVYSRFW